MMASTLETKPRWPRHFNGYKDWEGEFCVSLVDRHRPNSIPEPTSVTPSPTPKANPITKANAMLVQNLFLAVALSATGLAIDVDDAEVPYQCRDVCIPVIRLTSSCDAQICMSLQATKGSICKS